MCDQVAQCRFVTEATVRTSPMNLSDPRFGKHALNTIARTDQARQCSGRSIMA
jgi:hypothetical protein